MTQSLGPRIAITIRLTPAIYQWVKDQAQASGETLTDYTTAALVARCHYGLPKQRKGKRKCT